MTKKIALWIFLLGTASSAALFLGLTVDTHRQVEALSHADKISDEVVAGKHAFEKFNCNDCHTILGFGAYYAPDLTKVYRRRGADGIRESIKNPEKVFAASWRKMQKQNIPDEDIEHMISFFKWVGEINNNDWPPQDSTKKLTRSEQALMLNRGVSPGAAVFQKKGCMNCHALQGTGGTEGPALDTIGRKRSAEQLEKYIRNPKSVETTSVMAAEPNLTNRELEEVSKFLSGLK